MLTIRDPRPAHNCQGLHRRDFLRIGALGLGTFTLADLFKLKAAANSDFQDRAVVFLFLHGGPPQHETFDPKMDATEEYRSAFGDVKTNLPGVSFGSTFPKLAAMADRLAIVRSFASRNGGHEYTAVASGGNGSKATMSAVYASLAGTMHPVNGMPRNVLVLPEAVKEGLKLGSNFETSALPTLTAAGNLGSQFEAFNPVGGAQLKKSMELRLTREQFDDRKTLLANLDKLRRDVDSRGAIEREDRFHQQAFEVITRGISQAFDLSKEDSKTIERYDTSRLFRLEDATKWYDMKRASNLLGRQMLLARRLVEAGCGFVSVSDCGWDMHSNENSPKNLGGLHMLGAQVDHAVSAFLDDVHQRGLSEKILLIVTGEMGRTPKRNKNGGRDHWGDLTPLLVAGGGLKMGQVIGQSDKQGARPVSDPYTPIHLYSTVMHYLFDVPKLRLRTDLSREVKAAIETGAPISRLF